jgi:outer membrane lipoprotein carrier protein
MKYLIFFLLPITCELWAQQDPAAKEILDRVATKTSQYRSIQADFELIVVDHKEDNKNASNGKIIIKGEKYKMTSSGTEVYFDGKTMWNYVPADNEVTITEPDSQDGDFLSNPAQVLTLYNRDFKYSYRGETTIDGKAMHEIDLFPKNLDQRYSRIKVFITKDTEQLAIISSVGKDGVDYSVFLNNLVSNRDIADDVFIFDPAKHKKITIVDMRGL